MQVTARRVPPWTVLGVGELQLKLQLSPLGPLGPGREQIQSLLLATGAGRTSTRRLSFPIGNGLGPETA
jgi:hypothetical protein